MKMDSNTSVFTPFIIAKDKEPVSFNLVSAILKYLSSKAEIQGLNMGSSYNMPIYLLGELERVDEPIVFLINWDEEGYLRQKCLVGKYEIEELMKELEIRQDEDAWQVAMDVNARIRAEASDE